MTFVDDLRYAVRGFARRPGLLVVTGITLSIGIAANSIMFGVVDQLLLRPPAHVAEPALVRRIYFRDMEEGRANIGPVTTYPVLSALRASAPAFAELAAYGFPGQYSLGRGNAAKSVAVQLVSGNWFRLLGVRFTLGQGFSDDHDRIPVAEPVAVLSYGLWQQQFGGDTAVIGRTLLLHGKSFTVIGVAPRGFAGIDRQRIDVWLPISAFADETLGMGWHNTTNHWWAQIIGRLRRDVTPEVGATQATLAYRALVRQWQQRWRDSTSSVLLTSIIATRTPNGISRESKVSLWLLGVSAVVFLIACANVANLLIARTFERRREIAIRLALGVGRGRLVRLLLLEAGLLALLGMGVALTVWYGASQLVQNILLPNVVWSESLLDLPVFMFTLGLTVLCMLLAGLAPAVQGIKTTLADGLKASSRQAIGGRSRVRSALLLAQATLSVMLLVGAGLTVRSFNKLVSRDVGMDRDRVLLVTMPLSRFGFDSARTEDIYRRAVERLRQIPGVANVAVARLTVPLQTARASSFSVPGVERERLQLPGGGPYESAVTAGFFATVGARILQGRDFTAADERMGARVLVVNENVAKAYWPNSSAIGRCAKFGADTLCSEVVGVVRNVLLFNAVKEDRAIVYVLASHPGVRDAPPAAILARVSRHHAATIIPLVRREVQSLASTMPFVEVRPYSELVAPQLQPWRLGATMFTLFGVIALVIAAVGLYSVIAYWVAQRTQDIGVRMALGAQRSDVVWLVAAQSSRTVVAGVLLGGCAAFISSRWITDMLYETSPRDPLVYATAALGLVVAALIASIIPARRSTAVDPAQALRAE